MQEIALPAPNAESKPRPKTVREDAAKPAPAGRQSPENGRGEDFGSVVEAGERAEAKKTAPGPEKADLLDAPEAGPPPDAETDPSATPASDVEADSAETAPVPVFEAEAVEAEAGSRDAAAAEAETPDAFVPDDVAELVVPPAPATRSADGAAPAVPAGGRDSAAPADVARTAQPTPAPDAGEVAEAPAPDPESTPPARAGSEAPADAPRPSGANPAHAAQSPAVQHPAPAGGPVLGPAPFDGLDWRLTPQVHAPTRIHSAASVQPQAVTGQIAVAIAQSANSRIELRLDPPELGRVQIQLNPTERGVQVVVMSERAETGDFLRRHGETLARDLTEAGYGDVTMEFTAGGSGTPGDRDRAEAAAPRVLTMSDGSAPAPESVADTPRAVAVGTLDIRL